jgi:ABC-2 type transport system ATP-binding protein
MDEGSGCRRWWGVFYTAHVPVAVEIDNLVVRYGEKVAVDGLSLTVSSGTVTSVVGPNGAGKTTTVESCEGFRRPDSGRVRVLGLDPVADHDKLMPRLGVMLQEGGAWSGVRALEMLRYVATLHAHPLDVPMLAERLDLGSCGRTPYRRLSGGQKQRLSFALAIVGRPEIAFLDEPTTGLDPHGRREIWQVIRELRDDGVTVVLTTHAMDEAEQLSDLVHVLSGGKVIASGSPDVLTAHGAKSLEDVYLALTAPPRRNSR